MGKRIILFAVMLFFIMMISPVLARTIRMEPHGSYYGEPIMLKSPATFNISVTAGGDPTCDPHIFLVMTETSYNNLTNNVTVVWDGGSLEITEWNSETNNNVKAPHNTSAYQIASGDSYTVASLRDHLKANETIYWAFEPFLDGQQLTQTPIEFIVTLPSTEPRMLVYALGKLTCPPCSPLGTSTTLSQTSCIFNNSVPPTQPGFVVPQLSTFILALTSFSAFALYVVKKRHQ